MPVKNIDGISVYVPNTVSFFSKEKFYVKDFEKEYEGFYISYNPSSKDYGSDTTALVLGQMEAFLILNGDHRENYYLANQEGSFEKVYEYYINSDCINKEFTDTKESLEKFYEILNKDLNKEKE